MRWPWQHADPEEILELEAENTLLDEYIDSDGEIPCPDLSGNDREILAERELEEANVRAQNFVQRQEPFHVEMQPLAPPPKKKREFFKPPILDGRYFEHKRAEQIERERTRFYSASMVGYEYRAIGSHYAGSASHHGGGTWSNHPNQCERFGHVIPFGSDRCMNCQRYSWE